MSGSNFTEEYIEPAFNAVSGALGKTYEFGTEQLSDPDNSDMLKWGAFALAGLATGVALYNFKDLPSLPKNFLAGGIGLGITALKATVLVGASLAVGAVAYDWYRTGNLKEAITGNFNALANNTSDWWNHTDFGDELDNGDIQTANAITTPSHLPIQTLMPGIIVDAETTFDGEGNRTAHLLIDHGNGVFTEYHGLKNTPEALGVETPEDLIGKELQRYEPIVPLGNSGQVSLDVSVVNEDGNMIAVDGGDNGFSVAGLVMSEDKRDAALEKTKDVSQEEYEDPNSTRFIRSGAFYNHESTFEAVPPLPAPTTTTLLDPQEPAQPTFISSGPSIV